MAQTSPVRYIRDHLAGSAPFNGNSSSYWVEIQAYLDGGTNAALGATVTANYSGEDLTPVTDGVTDSEVYTVAPGPGSYYVTVDLGSVQDIASLTVWHYYADGRVFQGTRTDVSTDGINWVTLFDSAISGTYAEDAAGRSHAAPFNTQLPQGPDGSTPRPIPSFSVNLSSYGGVPGAAPNVLTNAFDQAFTALKNNGGGTLVIDQAGTYNFGNRSNLNDPCAQASDLADVRIEGYGATLVMTTSSTGTPIFFSFSNPDNVTVAGVSFRDDGSDINIIRGAVCIWHEKTGTNIQSGFKTVDCVADNVILFVAADHRDNPYVYEGFDIHGTVRNSYYGLQMHRTGRFSRCDITAINVRRAFIGHSNRDWEINVDVQRTGGPASNACVTVSPFPSYPVLNCNINITASGALNGYGCIGQIIHQGAAGAYSYANNVVFDVRPSNVTSAASIGFVNFSAEPEAGGGKLASTVGEWQSVDVKGVVTGSYPGRMVSNDSPSTGSGNSIRVANALVPYQSMATLPSYFSTYEPEPEPPPVTALPKVIVRTGVQHNRQPPSNTRVARTGIGRGLVLSAGDPRFIAQSSTAGFLRVEGNNRSFGRLGPLGFTNYFNGVANAVRVPGMTNLPVGPLTIMCMFKKDVAVSSGTLLACGGLSGIGGWKLAVDTVIRFSGDGLPELTFSMPSGIIDGGDYVVVLALTGNGPSETVAMHLGRFGYAAEHTASQQTMGGTIAASTLALAIGATTNGSIDSLPFNGNIGSFAIWNRYLDEDERMRVMFRPYSLWRSYDSPIFLTTGTNVDLSSPGMTGQLGTVTLNIDGSTTVTGVQATGHVGVVSTAGGIEQPVLGLQATGQLGFPADIKAGGGHAVTGLEAIGELGQASIIDSSSEPVEMLGMLGEIGQVGVAVWSSITINTGSAWVEINVKVTGVNNG